MVLLVGDQLVKEVPSTIAGIYSLSPRLKEIAQSVTASPPEAVGSRGLLYLRHREYAVTAPGDENVQYLGTDDACTSVMAVLRHTGNGAVALAHFDKCSHAQCLEGVHICSHDDGVLHIMQRIAEIGGMRYSEGRLELSVVGGFQDSRRISERVALSLLNAFHKTQQAHIHLLILCTGEMNTCIPRDIHFPIIKGIGVNTQTGKIFPATFADKGPDFVIRSTRIFTGAHQMVDVYDFQQGVLRIGPFNYDPHGGVEILLNQSDHIILQCLSTTPEVEGPEWVKMVREVLKQIKEHPFPSVTIYPDNKPHYFRRDSLGSWIRTDLPNNNDSTPDANLQGVNLQQLGTWSPPGTIVTTSAQPPTPVAPQPWGSTVPARYSSIQLDCRLKTHLSVPPVVNNAHYEDPVLSHAKERYIPAWPASHL